MIVTLELGDNVAAGLEEQVDVDLPAPPGIGEQVLYCDDAPDGHGGTYTRHREYRVRMVDWTVMAGEVGAAVLVRLDFIGDGSGTP